MKYLVILVLALSVTCCTPYCCGLKPDHVGIETGVEFEIEKDHHLKTTPSVTGCLDWNL